MKKHNMQGECYMYMGNVYFSQLDPDSVTEERLV